MCTLVEEYAKEYAKEAASEAVDRIIKALNLEIAEACQLAGITVDDYNAFQKKTKNTD